MLKLPNDRTIPLMVWLIALSALSIWSIEILPIRQLAQSVPIKLADAQLEDIMAIPRIQLRVAHQILKVKDKVVDWIELQKIRGVGPKTLEQLRGRFVLK